MKQQELIDLLKRWGVKEVAPIHFVLEDKIAKYRVVITPHYIDFTVYVSYLGKKFSSFERFSIEYLKVITSDQVLFIIKEHLYGAMKNFLKHYISCSFLKELDLS